MKLVSVIVPIYKVPRFIEKCVTSLLKQTYTHLEIILVDDGSPDECPAICDAFAAQDARVRVIHQQNGGLSAARNAGIQAANGVYLAFVDGDDFVAPDYIETLLNACEEHDTKMAACGYFEYYSEERSTVICADETTVLSTEEAITDIFTMNNRVQVMAWNKLYGKELFDNTDIRYPVGKIHEDVFTTYRCCSAAGRVACVNKPCYYYVQREGSIISQTFSTKRLQLLEAVNSIQPFVESHAPIYNEAYTYYVFLNHLTIINAMADSNYFDKQLFGKLRRCIRECLPDLKKNPYFNLKNQLTCLLLDTGMRGYYMFRKLYKGYR